MIGDSFGYDPGGRLFPVLAGAVMFICSTSVLWQVLRSAPNISKADKQPLMSPLVVSNIVAAFIFILSFRFLGYIIASGLFVCTLICLNQRQFDRTLSFWGAVRANATTLIGLLILYSIGRGIVKLCFSIARNYGQPAFREPIYQAALVLIMTLLAFLLFRSLTRRFNMLTDQRTTVLTSIGIVYGIYILFRQIFLVQLPNGLLFW